MKIFKKKSKTNKKIGKRSRKGSRQNRRRNIRRQIGGTGISDTIKNAVKLEVSKSRLTLGGSNKTRKIPRQKYSKNQEDR